MWLREPLSFFLTLVSWVLGAETNQGTQWPLCWGLSSCLFLGKRMLGLLR